MSGAPGSGLEGGFHVVIWWRESASLQRPRTFCNWCSIETSSQEVIMPAKPQIALVTGSTRPTRFADKPAHWMLKQVQASDDMEIEVIDLREYPLDERAGDRS
jgi:hypothetical protein